MRVSDFVAFITKREEHRLAKEGKLPSGAEQSWEPDPIIAQYRFCNVQRNDDRVTKWIHENLMYPLANYPHLWFVLVIARLFNNPQTLAAFDLSQYIMWRPAHWRKKLNKLREHGTIFNAAYIVSTNGRAMDKVDYVVDCILNPLWRGRYVISESIDSATTLDEAHKVLMSAQGLGSFMAAQVLADLKYAGPRSRWKDWHTFAASGPGSRRGLNRVLGGPLKQSRTE